MANEATPRVNAKYLENFMHQTVRIVGKVTALHGETANIDAEGQISIHLNREAHIKLNNACEIIGRVQDDLSVKVFQASDWGSSFDYAMVNELVDITHKYMTIFYEKKDE